MSILRLATAVSTEIDPESGPVLRVSHDESCHGSLVLFYFNPKPCPVWVWAMPGSCHDPCCAVLELCHALPSVCPVLPKMYPALLKPNPAESQPSTWLFLVEFACREPYPVCSTLKLLVCNFGVLTRIWGCHACKPASLMPCLLHTLAAMMSCLLFTLALMKSCML